MILTTKLLRKLDNASGDLLAYHESVSIFGRSLAAAVAEQFECVIDSRLGGEESGAETVSLHIQDSCCYNQSFFIENELMHELPDHCPIFVHVSGTCTPKSCKKHPNR